MRAEFVPGRQSVETDRMLSAVGEGLEARRQVVERRIGAVGADHVIKPVDLHTVSVGSGFRDRGYTEDFERFGGAVIDDGVWLVVVSLDRRVAVSQRKVAGDAADTDQARNVGGVERIEVTRDRDISMHVTSGNRPC